MKKKILLVLFVSFSVAMNAQKKTCNTTEEILEDLNSITKCTINKKSSKKTHVISVKVSAARTRFRKNRTPKKSVSNDASLTANGVAIDSVLSKSLAIKKKIASLSNNLSAEEMKIAQKFSTVDKIPAFQNCKSEEGEDRTNCFNKEMVKHIVKYFYYPNEAVMKHIEGDVWVRFVIDKDGNVSNIKAHVSNVKAHDGSKNGGLLKEEALRVVSHLPKFIPATKGGKNISVKYGFPINFELSE